MNVYYVMAIWVGMALVASFISIRVGVSVALIEILVGAIAGNIPGIREHVQQTDYTTLLAGIGSVLLTFLAGAEIDPVSLKKHWKASLSMGVVSFLLPLIGAFCFARYGFHWNFHASEIAGIALSTTSVAVVYAVMVETGLNRLGYGPGSGRTLRELRLATPRVRPRDSRGPVLLAEDPSLGRRERRSSRQRAGGESDIRRSPRARRTGDGGGK